MAKKQLRRKAPAEAVKPARREVPRVTADPEKGLNLSQVKERQHHGWANDSVESPTKTVGQIVRENCCTFFNFIFIVLAALLIAVGSLDDLLFLSLIHILISSALNRSLWIRSSTAAPMAWPRSLSCRAWPARSWYIWVVSIW